MSADNGVYILKTKDRTGYQYRVKHLRAIENLYYGSTDGKPAPREIIDMFGDVRYTKDANMAITIAEAIHKELHTCEYGIRIIPVNKTWGKIVWESKYFSPMEAENNVLLKGLVSQRDIWNERLMKEANNKNTDGIKEASEYITYFQNLIDELVKQGARLD